MESVVTTTPDEADRDAPAVDVTRLRVALARLARRLRKHELAGLTPTQLAALATVERSGPMRLGDLAAAEGIAPSTLTRLVTALEESGLVRRHACTKPSGGRTRRDRRDSHDVARRRIRAGAHGHRRDDEPRSQAAHSVVSGRRGAAPELGQETHEVKKKASRNCCRAMDGT